MRGLLDEGTAVVIGLPRQFDFSKRLSRSSHIRMATAFAHMSGWNLIGDSIAKCKGQVDVVAGLSFFQTEPLLLTRWSKLSRQADNFCCRVVTNDKLGKRTFHPKVLIASGSDGTHFAVVGSGNLSAGGLRHNVECSIFTEDKKLIADLRTWFDDVYKNLAVPVDEAIIRRYKPLYDKYRARSRELAHEESVALAKVEEQVTATLRDRQRAVAEAKLFFAGPEFATQLKKVRGAAKQIRACLNYPQFDFSYDRWQEFLNIRELGNLAALQFQKRQLIRNWPKLRKAFRLLIDDSRDIRVRLEEVLSGEARVHGIGKNVVTKILAAHDGRKWPVYNSKVQGVLETFGYEIPRGLSDADKYIAYARLMQEFALETKAKDVYALDLFFLDRSGGNRKTEESTRAE